MKYSITNTALQTAMAMAATLFMAPPRLKNAMAVVNAVSISKAKKTSA